MADRDACLRSQPPHENQREHRVEPSMFERGAGSHRKRQAHTVKQHNYAFKKSKSEEIRRESADSAPCFDT